MSGLKVAPRLEAQPPAQQRLALRSEPAVRRRGDGSSTRPPGASFFQMNIVLSQLANAHPQAQYLRQLPHLRVGC
jgi:hypothetical protein